jgi:hypothetical protein
MTYGDTIAATDRLWPKADPENWSFAVVKASALEKSGHQLKGLQNPISERPLYPRKQAFS